MAGAERKLKPGKTLGEGPGRGSPLLTPAISSSFVGGALCVGVGPRTQSPAPWLPTRPQPQQTRSHLCSPAVDPGARKLPFDESMCTISPNAPNDPRS